MKPAISTVCSLNAPLETILEDYSAGQCRLIEVWLGHAELAIENGCKPAQFARKLVPSLRGSPHVRRQGGQQHVDG